MDGNESGRRKAGEERAALGESLLGPGGDDPSVLLRRYRKAKERRGSWESHWQECYDYALPLRDGMFHGTIPGERKADRLFDGTAPDCVDQLAASLLSELTPPWAQWFGLAAGDQLPADQRDEAAPLLERVAAVMQSHFDRSNFAIEMHQCYLDAVTGGTASLLFEEAPPGEPSAFRFTSVPLGQVVLEEGGAGRLDVTFRRSELSVAALKARFPRAVLPEDVVKAAAEDPDLRLGVVEAVVPVRGGYSYAAVLDDESSELVLGRGQFSSSPFLNFRWLKAPGEVYGRSPVMKALPDIKTANKVVELVLKNATIAVTGIWQADDDGVLNPANIKLVPGTIIPKAVGSAGLQPLTSPGRFDTSQLVLDDLRGRIRHALLGDKLSQPASPALTATEILQRSDDMARLLGATYGRLQSELLTPLVMRAVHILRRRGEIPALAVDGRTIDLQYRSPLAQNQGRRDARNVLSWLGALSSLGPAALSTVDAEAAARWLARAFNVPSELVQPGSAAPPDAPLPDPRGLERVIRGLGASAAAATPAKGGAHVPA
ncbi:portal protein [Magnetospirillum sp. 15-1]|uniref:portal protein n=1 Tax=Magnetospirillum sp. 15-1 TaxID=1979370 RepID=UPI000BBCD66A|nr:portal protein [Magnetospirillum sp. 15-1]